MLTIPHVTVGMAIGALVADLPAAPALAFGLGLGSHYLLDSIPHWERVYRPHEHDFSTESPAREWPRHIFIQAVVDVLLAVTIVGIATYYLKPSTEFWRDPLLWGAVGAFLPDFLDNTPVINRLVANWPILKHERDIHKRAHIATERQQAAPPYLGIITQLVVVLAAITILLLI